MHPKYLKNEGIYPDHDLGNPSLGRVTRGRSAPSVPYVTWRIFREKRASRSAWCVGNGGSGGGRHGEGSLFVRKAVLFLCVERWCEVDSRFDSGVSRCGKAEALPCLWSVAGKGPITFDGDLSAAPMPRRGLGPCGWDAFTCPMCIPKGVLRSGWRRHGYGKRGEAAVADAAASSGIRAPNKKSPLPRAGSGHAHIVSSFPAGGIPVSGYTLLARFPWASPLGNANSEVLRYRFCSRRTLPETTGLCQALCSHRNVRASCLFSRFSEAPENVFTERARP